MEWSWLVGSYHEQIIRTGRQPLLLLLVGLVLAFVAIRTSTRLIRAQVKWWPGNISAGGVHIHHEFVGMLILIASGTVAFGTQAGHPWRDLLAFAFGVGAGLVLDEYALLLHLQDVYWTREGRSSVDAVVVAISLTALLLVHAAPFGLHGIGGEERTARWVVVGLAVTNLVLTLVVAAKGRPFLAVLGVFVTFLALWGAVRLARPHSPWARRRYSPATLDRATCRAAVSDRRLDRLQSLVAGRVDG